MCRNLPDLFLCQMLFGIMIMTCTQGLSRNHNCESVHQGSSIERNTTHGNRDLHTLHYSRKSLAAKNITVMYYEWAFSVKQGSLQLNYINGK